MKCLECQRLMRPYLMKELSDRELSQFLDHVEHCENCYEELELNMAVTSALDEKSDLRDNSVYDFEEKLKKEIAASRRHLRFVHTYGFSRRLLVIFAEIVLVITIVTAVELNMFKDHSKTHLYKVMHRGKNTVEILTEAELESASDEDAENVSEDRREKMNSDTELLTEEMTEAITEAITEAASEEENEKSSEETSELTTGKSTPRALVPGRHRK